jgi:hypothetical protein
MLGAAEAVLVVGVVVGAVVAVRCVHMYLDDEGIEYV